MLGGVVAAVGAAALTVALSQGSHHGRTRAASSRGQAARETTAPSSPVALRDHHAPVRLVSTPLAPLEAPLQDAAGSGHNGHAVVLGGLTAADASTDTVITFSAGTHHVSGRLPAARHDAAAVGIGSNVYVFGGGNGVSQLDEIVRVDSRGASGTVVGHLPAPSSDLGAATIAGTAFIVGGYTGRAWLDTIVAWRPGGGPRVVAHLPTPLRYAAVSAAGGRLVIAGGSLPSGAAGRDVYMFDPGSRRVRRIGGLPAPTTHAAAAALDGLVFVIGGRGAAAGSATDRIVSVDPARARIRAAGRLPRGLSDLTALSLPGRIVVVGGRSSAGTVAGVLELRLARIARPGASAHVTRASRSNASAAGVYVHDGRNMFSAVTRGARPRVYVPNSLSDTVDVIDPASFRVVARFAVGALPQHVTPAYDLKTLYVLNDRGNSLTPIDPRTARPGAPIPVADPYNMYFTPDGRYAIVVAERNARLDFRDPHTFRLHRSLPVPCRGVDHVDFSADGSYLIASCEFSSELVKVDVKRERVTGSLTVGHGHGMPQDVKLSPDGRVFYVADMMAGGLWEVSGSPLRTIGFLPTGSGAHGLYPSRDARLLYVSNRAAGTVSVVSFAERKVIATWSIPGGSPDMGGVSADGRVLWLSGRYDAEVYAIDTRTGRLLRRIKVGSGPHGLSVWPQPGRFSLGHTGIMR